MNLDELYTRTTVTFNSSQRDSLIINDHAVTGKRLERVSSILDLVRGKANINEHADVVSTNNFPAGAETALTAAAFAALCNYRKIAFERRKIR
jgi:diphosphomevalonate decarboxylase